MKYCNKCIQPDTRPGISFNDEGICGACLYHDNINTGIDWKERKKEALAIAERVKKEADGAYDCVVGVSGGKDSTFQALYVRDKLGLRPLLVNSEPDGITEIGAHNIENLKQLGFDVISLRPNPIISKKLAKADFYRYLNPVKPSEYTLWSSAYIIAEKFGIKLIIQGENPDLNFGVGSTTSLDRNALRADQQNTITKNYLEEYLVEGIDKKDLFLYHYNAKQLDKIGVKGIWLNYYAKEWSQLSNAIFASHAGYKIRPENIDFESIGTYRRFAQLDSTMVQVNQMLKYIKFGFGQAMDHACYDIREKIISREEGIALVKAFDGKCGKGFIEAFCVYIGISIKEFWRVCDQFRGGMFKKDEQGSWQLKNPLWKEIDVDHIDILKVIKRITLPVL